MSFRLTRASFIILLKSTYNREVVLHSVATVQIGPHWTMGGHRFFILNLNEAKLEIPGDTIRRAIDAAFLQDRSSESHAVIVSRQEADRANDSHWDDALNAHGFCHRIADLDRAEITRIAFYARAVDEFTLLDSTDSGYETFLKHEKAMFDAGTLKAARQERRGLLNHSQTKDLEDLFAKLDQNGDGVIDVEELRDAMQEQLGFEPLTGQLEGLMASLGMDELHDGVQRTLNIDTDTLQDAVGATLASFEADRENDEQLTSISKPKGHVAAYTRCIPLYLVLTQTSL